MCSGVYGASRHRGAARRAGYVRCLSAQPALLRAFTGLEMLSDAFQSSAAAASSSHVCESRVLSVPVPHLLGCELDSWSRAESDSVSWMNHLMTRQICFSC